MNTIAQWFPLGWEPFLYGGIFIGLGVSVLFWLTGLIGGVSTAGGIGSVLGALLGVLFAGVINGALPVIHISPFWQQAISGTVILVAVIVNARSERRAGKQILPPKGAQA